MGGKPIISIVIPTFNRERVLCDTLQQLLIRMARDYELVVVDQTRQHEAETEWYLQDAGNRGLIRRLTLPVASTPCAMNQGLRHAGGDIVLFLDDDIALSDDLPEAHLRAHQVHAHAWAVVGQILQPMEVPVDSGGYCPKKGINAFIDFPFCSMSGAWVSNVMAGNLSVRRERAIAVGGFDENFVPPVAYRFETEFARRIMAHGGRIWFEPRASVRHLRAHSGGTRSLGSHLTSISPLYGVGDYYYALRCGRGMERLAYIMQRPFREVRTKYHLRYPWWIPIKFLGELRALWLAMKLNRQGPKLIGARGEARNA